MKTSTLNYVEVGNEVRFTPLYLFAPESNLPFRISLRVIRTLIAGLTS